MRDKSDVLSTASEEHPVALELGVGANKRNANSIGVDSRDHVDVDIVGDALEVLRAFPASSVSSIESEHFLEHVDDLQSLLIEAARTLRPGGVFRAAVPHFSSPYYYSDPTHRQQFGLYTFCYLVRRSRFKRKVPQYSTPLPFELTRVELVFKSPKPFVFRYVIKRSIGAIFNMNRATREFYEENLCWIFPCYEISYELQRI